MDEPRQYKYPLLSNEKSSKKMSKAPLIFPRLSDPDVWSFPSYKHSATNFNNMNYDYSQEYGNIPQVDDYNEYDPRVQTYTNFNLNRLDQVCESKQYQPPNGIYQQHPAMFNDVNYQATPQQYLPPDTTPIDRLQQIDQNGYINQSEYNDQYNQGYNNRGESGMDNRDRSREAFSPRVDTRRVDTRRGDVNRNDNMNRGIKHPYQYKSSNKTPNNREGFRFASPPDRQTANYPLPQDIYSETGYRTDTRTGESGGYSNDNQQWAPPTDLLIPKTITSVYGKGAVSNEERIKYLQTVQPDNYTMSDVAYPINANLGISYNPDIPPLVIDQVATPYNTAPLYHRIDPQLVRDQNIAPDRLGEMPRRTAQSSRYGVFDAAPGTVGFEDIYDPRFNGYGDEYRSYGDVNLGQVQYYYSDLDNYREVNFPFRSNVDFIDFHDPMGRILPEYQSQIGVDDIKTVVGQQWDSDQLYFRSDLMERQMRKRNAELWQLRASPMLKTNNTHSFSSNY